MPGFRKWGRYYVLGALALLAVLVWQAVFWIEGQRGHLSLYAFDVGQGDALLLRVGNGTEVLVDGGPDASVISRLGEAMPFWDRSIDLVILTHPHADHLDGLVEVLKRYDVGMAMESGVNHSIPEYAEWHALLREKGVKIVIARTGQRVRLSDAAYLDVLTPATSFEGASVRNIHDAMVVLKLVSGAAEALLMGDAERLLERTLIASGIDLDVDLLKVGHHGSKTSTSEEFLRATTPRIAIVSVGRKNRYGHPVQEVLDRLAAFGAVVVRTDRDGTATFASDGQQFSLRRAR